jgi:hypothetical protein
MVNEMTYYSDELDKDLKEKLDLLHETPPRDPVKALQRREEYLKQVKYLQYGKPVFTIASLLNSRAWKTLFSRRPSLVPFAAAVLLIFWLVFGSVGTVYAAQDSLPNDLLYSIKLAGENLRLALTADTEDRISLLTSYADRRLQEATILDEQGQPIPVELATLMDGYFNELISLTASLDETAELEDPVAVSRTLRPQDRDQARTNPVNDNQLELTQLRNMVEACHRLASTGDVDFNQIQNRFQNQFEYAEQEQAQGDAPDSPFTHKREQTFKHQQGVTSTLTSTITTTLTITPEITGTLTITPSQRGSSYGPGPCILPDDSVRYYYCDLGWGPGPFNGVLPDEQDGYGSSGEQAPGPQQPSEPSKAGEPKQSPETPNNGDSGKDGKQEGSSGSQNSKP